jgi:glc operon protein GlcG
MKTLPLILTVLLALSPYLNAQPQNRPSYGPAITLEQAKKVLAAAETEARKNDWNVVIAVVDTGGNLVVLQRMDDTQIASITVAQQKAWSAASYRRPTKTFEDTVAAGPAGARVLALHGAMPVEGGLPIVANGKIIGAIGVSGVTSQQDGQIASAGLAALTP